MQDQAQQAVNTKENSMNLQPGTRLQIFTHRGHKPMQYVSAVIGFDFPNYILIQQPRESGSLLTFIDGEKLTVRVFSGTTIFAFDSVVLKTLAHPVYCLCIACPLDVRTKKVRSEMRIKVAMGAEVVRASGSEQVSLQNLSATGCLIMSSNNLGSFDDELGLRFTLPPGDGEPSHEIDVHARIRNVMPHGAAGMTTGVEFVKVGATESLVIRNYVYEMMLDGRQNIA